MRHIKFTRDVINIQEQTLFKETMGLANRVTFWMRGGCTCPKIKLAVLFEVGAPKMTNFVARTTAKTHCGP